MESIYEEQWVKSFVWTLGIVQSCFLSFFLLHATTDCPWGTTFLYLRTQLWVKVIVIDLLKINHRKRYLGELPTQLFHAASGKRMWRRLLWTPYYLYICNCCKKDKPPIVNVRDGLFVTVVQHESKVQQLSNCISRNLKLHRVLWRFYTCGQSWEVILLHWMGVLNVKPCHLREPVRVYESSG